MERNDNYGTPAAGGVQGGAAGNESSFGGTSGQQGGSSGMSASSGASGSVYGASDVSTMSDGSSMSQGTQGVADKAKDKLQQGKEAVQERLGTIKEKATDLQATLADKLDAGADKLRQRAQSGMQGSAQTGSADGAYALAGNTGGTTSGAAANDKVATAANQLASGMSSTADWLRNGDLRGDIEQQVKDHPGRTLLIALGLGYLLGKSLKR